MKRLLMILLVFNAVSAASTWAEDGVPADRAEQLKREYHANEWHRDRFLNESKSLLEKYQDKPIDEVSRLKLQTLKDHIQVLNHENEKILNSLKPSMDSQGTIPDTPAPKPSLNKDVLRASDWRSLSVEEKESYVYSAIGKLELQGAMFLKNHADYLRLLDEAVGDPDYANAVMDNLFMLKVYENEPQARPTLQRLLSEATSA